MVKAACDGQRLDEQLRLVYVQITKNGVMDLKNAMFLAHTFRVSPYTVREVYNRFYPGAHNGLTRPQFVHVMRQSMNMGGGSDGDGLTDRGRDLHRSFSITDAPLDVSRLPTTSRPNPKLSVDSQSEGDTKADTVLVADIANGIRSLESTLVLRETQRGKPFTPTMTSRFFQGSVTPRRISTACFVPSQRNLTMAARRPTTADERAFLIRGNGGNRLFNGGQTAFSREQYGESAWAGWVERTGKCSEINPFAPVAYTRPRTAAEMGRTVKVQEGNGALLGAHQTDSELSEDAERHSRTLLEKIATQLRRLNVQRVDALQPFEHFDVGGTGQVRIEHARIALAEIDVTLSLSAIREISTVLNALGKNDSVKYPILVGALCPVVTDTKSRTKVAFISRNTSKRWCSDPSLSVTGMPLGVSDAFLKLSNATQGVPELFADQLRVLDVHKTGRCNPAGVKDVLKAFLSEAQAEMMCNYLVAENNKISLLSEHGLIQYQRLLRTMHKETALRKKAAGERPIFLKDGGSYTQKPKIPRAKTMLDIPEPSERRRTGLASVYKKMNSQVRSPSKLQMVFESVDTTLTGTVSLDSFHAVLEKLNIRLAEDETIILMEQLDPQNTGKVVYAEFIALMFPPEIIKKDEQVFVPAKPTFGPESLQASISSMAGLSNENILKILRDGCYRALAAGPEKIKQEYSIFRMPGDSEVTASDVKRFALDFGLHLSEPQSVGLLLYLSTTSKDPQNVGRVKYYHFMKMVLPPDSRISEGQPKGRVSSLVDYKHLKYTGGVPAPIYSKTNQIVDEDFNAGMQARLRRQLLRKSVKGVAPGVQLRATFDPLTGKDVQDDEILRMLLDHSVLIDREELSKYLNNFRSPVSGLVSVTKFIEALEPEAYDLVFPTSAPVAGAGLNLVTIKREDSLMDRDTDPHMWEGTWLHGKRQMPRQLEGPITLYNRIGHRECSDQEVRNCLRRALAKRIAHDSAQKTNLFKMLRSIDSSRDGKIGPAQFNVFLLKVGLKVEAEGNLERLWRTIASDADVVDIMDLVDVLTSEFESIPRKPRDKIRDKFKFR